jgi:transcriptional regulator of arginine metabolism
VHDKERRHQFLRELVEGFALETQEQVAEALTEAGFPVTQATVSRDIRDLQLMKVPTPDGRHRYVLPPSTAQVQPATRLERLLAEAYRSLACTGNLLVLKVMPGNAHAVGAVLDSMNVPGLLGTIAGDDTLLLVTSDSDAALALESRLRPAALPAESHPH